MTYFMSNSTFKIIILSIVLGPLGLIFFIIVGTNKELSDRVNRAFDNSKNPLLVSVIILTCIFLFAMLCCLMINPIDSFEDYTDISAAVTALEKRTCNLIIRVDTLLEGEVGNKGMESDAEGNSKTTPAHREFVFTAQRDARAPAKNNIVECGISPTADIDTRLARIEDTLRQFISPVLLRSFDSAMNSPLACSVTRIPCYEEAALFTNTDKKPIDESMFIWTSDPKGDLKKRLANIVEALNCYEKRIMKPLDEKIERMKRGELSDCEKKNATKSMGTSGSL